MGKEPFELSSTQQALWVRTLATGTDLTNEIRIQLPGCKPARVLTALSTLCRVYPILNEVHRCDEQSRAPRSRLEPAAIEFSDVAASALTDSDLREHLWEESDDLATSRTKFLVASDPTIDGVAVYASVSHALADGHSLDLLSKLVWQVVYSDDPTRCPSAASYSEVTSVWNVHQGTPARSQAWFPRWPTSSEDRTPVVRHSLGSASSVAGAARTLGATPFLAIAACYMLALGECGERSVVPIAYPWIGRTDPAEMSLLGPMSSTGYLRVDTRQSPSFGEVLRSLRHQLAGTIRRPTDPLAVVRRIDTEFYGVGKWWVGRRPVPSLSVAYANRATGRPARHVFLHLAESGNERVPYTDVQLDCTVDVLSGRISGVCIPGPSTDSALATRLLSRVQHLLTALESGDLPTLDQTARRVSRLPAADPFSVTADEASARLNHHLEDDPFDSGLMYAACTCRARGAPTTEAGLLASAYETSVGEELLPYRIAVHHANDSPICIMAASVGAVPDATLHDVETTPMEQAALFARHRQLGGRAPFAVFRRSYRRSEMSLDAQIAAHFDRPTAEDPRQET